MLFLVAMVAENTNLILIVDTTNGEISQKHP